jgi:hypothetical protein
MTEGYFSYSKKARTPVQRAILGLLHHLAGMFKRTIYSTATSTARLK